MSNIDILTREGGALASLDRSVINNVIFRSFVNDIQLRKFDDGSFVNMLLELSSSVLTSSNFTGGLLDLNRRDDDIVTNGQFSDAISVMSDAFLTSSEFRQFLDRLDPSLLEKRDSQFSFSGQLKAEYVDALVNNFTYETLQDSDLNNFINTIDLGLFRDGSFTNFITSTEAFVLTDRDFTDTMSLVNSRILSNGNFTNDIADLNTEVRTTNILGELVSEALRSDLLTDRGSEYTSILDLQETERVVASSSDTILLSQFDPRLENRPTYGLANAGLVSGGISGPGFDSERLVGFQNVRNENIAPNAQTWVIIHGFTSSSEAENIDFLEASVLEHANPGDRILSLDWREAAEPQQLDSGPFIAATWTRAVAEYAVQTLINEYSVSSDNAINRLNLVGHSLGTYVASEIGRVYRDGFGDDSGSPALIGNGIGVRTITALDPASGLSNPILIEGEGRPNPIQFDMDGSLDDRQPPAAFRDVSLFSRAFNGNRSIAGNEVAAATAHEAIAVVMDDTNLIDQHSRVVRAFARLDEDNGRIGNNLGIRAYADTSGTLGLREWEEFSLFPLSGTDRSYTAVLYVDENDQSRGLLGQTTDSSRDQIFIGGNGDDDAPGRGLPQLRLATSSRTLYGEGGSDTLTGSGGDDILVGGSATDFLIGGGGADTFVIGSGEGRSVIRDFDIDEGDVIGLSGSLTYSDLVFIGINDGRDTVITSGSSALIIADVDGVSPTLLDNPANFDSNFQLSPFGLD